MKMWMFAMTMIMRDDHYEDDHDENEHDDDREEDKLDEDDDVFN